MRQMSDFEPSTLPPEMIASIEAPFAGEIGGHILSADQFSADDFFAFDEIAKKFRDGEADEYADVGRGKVVTALMRQPSTRTAGSMQPAASSVGADLLLISGMAASSEAKGESLHDSILSLATQTDVFATRTPEEYGPHYAAHVIDQAVDRGWLRKRVPVINLGDGTNEHVTQAMGDMSLIADRFDPERFLSLTMVVFGDQQRYRAHHSEIKLARILGLNVIAVQCEAAPVPDDIVRRGVQVVGEDEFDDVIEIADILSAGRMPDEYTGDSQEEKTRSRAVTAAYNKWILTPERVERMPKDSILMHPLPKQIEIDHAVNLDRRSVYFQQMSYVIDMRKAILANAFSRAA